MSFRVDQVVIDQSVNDTLLALPPYLSAYYNIGDYKISASNVDNQY
jgi:hypothetical protein